MLVSLAQSVFYLLIISFQTAVLAGELIVCTPISSLALKKVRLQIYSYICINYSVIWLNIR